MSRNCDTPQTVLDEPAIPHARQVLRLDPLVMQSVPNDFCGPRYCGQYVSEIGQLQLGEVSRQFPPCMSCVPRRTRSEDVGVEVSLLLMPALGRDLAALAVPIFHALPYQLVGPEMQDSGREKALLEHPASAK